MDKKVTMKTKNITQDKTGKYGIWRTIRRVGQIFIYVGETANEAVARKRVEWLNTPTNKLKKQVQKPYQESLDSKVRNKLSSIRKDLEEYGYKTTTIYSFEYCYCVVIYRDQSYKILSRRRLR